MSHRFLRFLISGGSAAAVEYASFFILQTTLGLEWLLASQSLSFVCGFVISFLLNRHWVFRSEPPRAGISQARNNRRHQSSRRQSGDAIYGGTGGDTSAPRQFSRHGDDRELELSDLLTISFQQTRSVTL